MELPNSSVGLKLLALYSDDVRHPLVADCDDWEMIRAALIEFYDKGVLNVEGEEAAGLFRLLLENIYVMGYKRGKRDAQTEQ